MASTGYHYTLKLQNQFSSTLRAWSVGLSGAVNDVETASARMTRNAAKFTASFGVAMMASVPLMAASFLPLEAALARLGTVYSGTSAQIQSDLDDTLAMARKWSSGHIQSTVEVVRGTQLLATAGLSAAESIAGVATAATLATATGDKLTASAQLLASLWNTFGQTGALALMPMDAAMKDMGDTLANTVRRFQVTIRPLRDGLAFITGQAVALGLSLTEAVSVIGLLNTAGLRGSVAGAASQNFLLKIDDAVVKLGLNMSAFTDGATGDFTSMADMIDEVSAGLDRMGLTSFGKLLAVQDAFGQRAAKAVLILMDQRKTLRESTEAFRESTGAAKEMADMIEKTSGSKLKILMNQVVNLAQTVGEGLAPAMKSFAESFAAVMVPVISFVSKGPGMMAIFVGLAGAVILGTSALQIFNAMLVITGKEAVGAAVGIKAVAGAMATSLGLGLLTVGLGMLITSMNESTEVMARWSDAFNDSAINDAAGSFDALADSAALAAREIARANKAGTEISGGFLAKSFNAADVKALQGGTSVIDVLKPKATRNLEGSLKGLTGSVNQDFVDAGVKAIEELTAAGVSAENIMRGLSESTFMVQSAILGTGDATPEVIEQFGMMEQAMVSMTKRRDQFVDAFESRVSNRGNEIGLGSNPFARAIAELPLSEVFAERNRRRTGPDAGQLFGQKGLETLAAGHKFFKSDVFKKAFAGDDEILKIGLEIEPEFTLTSTLAGVEKLQAALAERAKTTVKGFKDLSAASSLSKETDQSNVRITNFIATMAKIDGAMKEGGRSSGGFAAKLTASSRAIDAQTVKLKSMRSELERRKSSKAEGIGNPLTAAFVDDRINQLEPLIVAEALALVGMEKLHTSIDLTAQAFERMGAVSAGQLDAVSSALGDTLGGGSFSNFTDSLFDSLSSDIKAGIVKGATEGFAEAAGLKFILSGDEFASRVKQAFANVNGDFTKLPDEFAKIKADMFEPGKLEDAKAAFRAIKDLAGEAVGLVAEGLNAGKRHAESMRDTFASLNPEAAKFASTMAELQTSLIGAGSAERLFGSQVEGLLRTGGGFGFDERLSAAVRGLEIARQEGLERTQSFGVLKAIVLEEHKRLELAKQINGIGGSPTDAAGTTTAAEATKSIVSDLASVKADAYADIASELERGVEAAEAIREALAVVSGGQLIPSSIAVSGGGSGEISIVRKGVTVNMTGGSGSTQQAMDELERRMKADLDQELEQIRAALSGK